MWSGGGGRPALGGSPLGADLPPAAAVGLRSQVSSPRSGCWGRRGRAITTVYGGSDVPYIGRLGSGLACNPTFLRWRSGARRLRSVRLSRVSSASARSGARALRSSSRAHGCRNASPLPITSRWPSSVATRHGRYRLEHEGRFASALSFSERDRDLVELATEIVITPRQDALELTAKFAGVATSYAFELCFRPGGEFGGVEQLGPDSYLLVEGEGSYRVAEDAIVFGPGGGSGPQQPAEYNPGEAYTFLSGTDALTWPRHTSPDGHPGSRRSHCAGRARTNFRSLDIHLKMDDGNGSAQAKHDAEAGHAR